jgi:hypothetical protein
MKEEPPVGAFLEAFFFARAAMPPSSTSMESGLAVLSFFGFRSLMGGHT